MDELFEFYAMGWDDGIEGVRRSFDGKWEVRQIEEYWYGFYDAITLGDPEYLKGKGAKL